MQYKKIAVEDASFLTEIFSIPEYDLYFAENGTTEEGWKDRIIRYYLSVQSYIILDGERKIGWIMYEMEGNTCSIDIIVLHPENRFKGYGKKIFADLISRNPQIQRIKLDVQQRNQSALAFYRKLGFTVDGEELQPIGETETTYFNMSLTL